MCVVRIWLQQTLTDTHTNKKNYFLPHTLYLIAKSLYQIKFLSS
uniref:Uncharacterized protein n=1 Tax=Rhizophora mucronata TaxID=61149 RepID=A0A2P2NGI3_RHIMU